MHPLVLEQLRPSPDTPPPVPERTLAALSLPPTQMPSHQPTIWRPTAVNLIDLLLPTVHVKTYTPDERRRARILAAFVILLVPNLVLGGVLATVTGSPALALGLFVVALTSLGALWPLHRSPSPHAAAWTVSIALGVFGIILAAGTGGITGFGVSALIMTPAMAVAVAPRAASLFALAASLVGAVALTIVPWLGGAAFASVAIPATVVATVTGSVFGLVLVIRRARELALEDGTQVNSSLAAEVKDHRRTRERLRDTHRELMDAARRAGAAEVATGVLHNVGNGLNAVNVSAAMVDERLHSLRLERIARLAKHLEEVPDLDPRLAAFANGVFRAIEDERDAAVKELRTLRQAVSHVAATVSTQQRWAQKAGVTEVIDVREMVEEVLTMMGMGSHHNIRVDLEIDDLPPVITDRHRVIQIISNLLNNAKDAVKKNRSTLRRIRVSASLQENDTLRIAVTDTGIGILPANLTRIFEHGFTTKPTGHGFGLHASAISAKELDGDLQAHSPGRGQGATFVLTVPVRVTTPY